jgi:hypothetical protein
LLREYVQAFALRSLHESEAYRKMAFVGGTALRFLENLPRFSEDLDFSLLDRQGYDPRRYLEKLGRDLRLAGFDCRVTFNDRKTVHSAWVRISGLLQQARLAARPEQNLAIELEIDTCPPAGAEVRAAVIARHMTFVVRHHSQPCLMAGKLQAILTRDHPKGRDWFDLLWYRARRPPIEPAAELLQNALDQTQGKGRFAASSWRDHVRQRLSEIDVARLDPPRWAGPWPRAPWGAALALRGGWSMRVRQMRQGRELSRRVATHHARWPGGFAHHGLCQAVTPLGRCVTQGAARTRSAGGWLRAHARLEFALFLSPRRGGHDRRRNRRALSRLRGHLGC